MTLPLPHVALTPLPEMQALGARWRSLEERSDGSFFLGWTWTQSWLSATGARPELLAVSAGGRDIALALIGRAAPRRPLGRVPTLYLNQSGSVAADRVFVEYNGLLTARDHPHAASEAMAYLMTRPDWRALRLAGIESGSPLSDVQGFHRHVLVSEIPAYFVDLQAVRDAGGDYLSLLSGNCRSQIRRSVKEYGPSDIMVARTGSVEEADEWLADMARLNAGRHADNAWDEPLFRAFVRELAARGLSTGEVEVLRIGQGDRLLGYLLNFLYRGRAMNYQSAFAPGISSKAKPGLMCHTAAVTRYADAGYGLYSLLAGWDRYKQSLSTGHELLQWWSLERFSPALEAEHLLRKILRRPISA